MSNIFCFTDSKEVVISRTCSFRNFFVNLSFENGKYVADVLKNWRVRNIADNSSTCANIPHVFKLNVFIVLV